MRFRNAFHLTIDNFGAVFRMLLYRLVTAFLTLSIVYVILKLSLGVIADSAEVETLRALVSDFFRALTTGDTARLQAFRDDFHGALLDLFSLLGANIGAIAGAIVGLCFMYLLSRFLNGLCVVAIANTMNDRMSAYARTSFSDAFFKNIGNASLYEIIYVPVSFLYDALSLLVCWLLFFYIPSFLPSWGFLPVLLSLCMTITLIVLFQALKMTLISRWLPSVVTRACSVGRGFGLTLRSGKNFFRRLGSYIVAVYLIVVVNVVCGLATFGSALFVTVPASFLFLLALQFTHFYEDESRKYFISVHSIAGTEPGEGDVPDIHEDLDELNRRINAGHSIEDAARRSSSEEDMPDEE